MVTTIIIKTWSCDTCPYNQDFEPTRKNMIRSFLIFTGKCPSCDTGKLEVETDKNKRIVHNTIDISTINNDNSLDVAEKNEAKAKRISNLVKSRAIEDNS